MKSIKRTILSIFMFLAFLTICVYPSNGDGCGTAAGTATISPISTLKVLVVFAQFKDDTASSSSWPVDTYPTWANTYVNPVANGSYSWNNLSQYYNEMSNGQFQVIGDVYDSLVTTDYNESAYSSVGEANYEVLTKIDPYVDYSDYDSNSDGKVDFIIMVYRNITMSNWYYTGISVFDLSSTIDADGVQIVDYSSIGGGTMQRGGIYGRDYSMYVTAHEIGHHLLGGMHINGISNLGLMTGAPFWNDDRGMCAWERERLGWMSYVTRSTNCFYWLSDYMTTNKALKIPISTNKFFIIEYRKKLSPHDKAGDEGIYVYHVTNDDWAPTIDVECADGNWNFVKDFTTETLTRTTPNPTGSDDEMNYLSGSYGCFAPYYHENSAGGDTEDAFDLEFNDVFSPKSNPRSTNSTSMDFTMEVKYKTSLNYGISLYFNTPYAGKPSKPQNLTATWVGDHPKLTWNRNEEPDMKEYKIYRKIEDETGWVYVTTLTQTSSSPQSWIDNDVNKPGKFDDIFTYSYDVVAVDSSNQVSVHSLKASINGTGLMWKSNDDEEMEITEIIKEYALSSNYPNPFNPTTQISYQITKNGFVNLVVYNALGQEVNQLVNQHQSSGKYSVKFNASNLPSGVYIYKLQAGEFSSVKKMMLIK